MSGKLANMRLHCFRAARQRARTTRWASSNRRGDEGGVADNAAKPATSSNVVSSVRTATPGTVRIRRGTDPRAQEVEMDTTIARIMGSDWGDRSRQPVSFAMKVYWGIFAVVLANGAFTYFAGKDENFLVDKVQKKVDEKLGRVETNEFVVMADKQNKSRATEGEHDVEGEVNAAARFESKGSSDTNQHKSSDEEFDPSSDTQQKSVFASKTKSPPMPFFGSPLSQQRMTKEDYERQLKELRLRQARVREESKQTTPVRSVDEVNAEIKRIDQQKAQIKQILKTL